MIGQITKLILSLIMIEIASLPSEAQVFSSPPSERPRNNIYVNLGDASAVSINYERLFESRSKFFLATKLGIGVTYKFLSNNPGYLTIPLHITANIGSKFSFLEFGFGATIINDNRNPHLIIYPLIGYRAQPRITNLLMFRIFVCLPLGQYDDLLDPTKEGFLFIPYGISVGRNF